MAMDLRLVNQNKKLFEVKGTDQYKKEFETYLEILKVVSVERGSSVIDMEEPFDSIIGLIYDGYEGIEELLDEYKQMVEALEEVNYSNLKYWQKNYNTCADLHEKAINGELN